MKYNTRFNSMKEVVKAGGRGKLHQISLTCIREKRFLKNHSLEVRRSQYNHPLKYQLKYGSH